MIKVEPAALLKFLEGKNYQPQLQEETNQIYIILKVSGKDFPVFLRIYEASDLLQLLVFMPCKIQYGAQADLARLLHLINKELDIPGFGMDESADVVFYRYMLPVPGKKIDEKLFETYLQSLRLICESLSPPVITVANGAATFAEIVRKAQEAARENPPTH